MVRVKTKIDRPKKYTTGCTSRMSPDYKRKLNILLGERQKKLGARVSFRVWVEEKIDEEYKKIT